MHTHIRIHVYIYSYFFFNLYEKITINRVKVKSLVGGFPGGAVVKNPPANAGNMGSSPGPGRSHMPRSN